MNYKNWLKGLAVAVLSAVVTTIAATYAAPASFNFSKAGLIKLAFIVVPVAAKAVLLYFQQSPLTPPATPAQK